MLHMDRSSRSPDLKSIEHIWVGLGKAISQRSPSSKTPGVQQEMAFPNRTKKQQVRTRKLIVRKKDDILDTLEEILVAIDTQLMPSAVNSDFEVKNQGSSHSLVSARSAEVKLPTLSLPIFSGVTEEWLAFSDLFESAVSNNNDLTGAQKLQYLKGSLKSDALKIINSLSITNDNFEIAWKLLKDRYFNKREIMSSLIKKFINITPLSGESSTQILNLIDSTKEFVRMLESLEYMVDPTTDTLLMHMILFKLDPNSRTWFERTFSTDVIPRLDELLQFLATQARDPLRIQLLREMFKGR
ncbi:integrase catalytic domain-containing protein [Trichonephila clavipes]|nr:integrase catalytic domain-containing protein [Trichonephila clavipes]